MDPEEKADLFRQIFLAALNGLQANPDYSAKGVDNNEIIAEALAVADLALPKVIRHLEFIERNKTK